MPVGIDTYKGLAPALWGESEIRGRSTDLDLLTLTGPSSQAGDFLVLRSQVPAGSTRVDSELFVVGSSGEVRTYQSFVSTISSGTGASTLLTIGTSQSGRIFMVDGGTGGLTIALPRSAPGLEYTFIQSSGHPGAIDITSTGGAEDILLAGGGGSSLASTVDAIAPASTLPGFAVRLLGLTTARWLAIPHVNVLDGTSAVSEARGGWVAGTTVA